MSYIAKSINRVCGIFFLLICDYLRNHLMKTLIRLIYLTKLL